MINRIIHGTSRRRNTDKCIDEVNAFLKHGAGENLHIIVPDQYSSYYEQLLTERSWERGSFQAEILTFKRLAQRVFTRNLKIRENYIDNAGKGMLMYNVIDAVQGSLTAFAKASAYPAFSIEAMKMIREFKRYGLNEHDIKKASETADDRLLSTKLSELSVMFSEYSERLEKGGFQDAEDDLSRLAEEIEESGGFERSIFWFDSFDSFTPPEYLVIKALMKNSKAVSFILCTDSLRGEDNSDIFNPVRDTASKILETADNLGISTEVIGVNSGDGAFSGINGEIEHLRDNYFRYPEKKYPEKVSSIKITGNDTIHEEVERCALEIARAVRQGKYRYGDICVVSGLYDEYRAYIDAIFSNYDIPVFLDEKRAISRHPACVFILSFLNIYIEKYSHESVFAFLKSPYGNFDSDDVSRLENYILEFDIKGVDGWCKKDWDDIPYNRRDTSSLIGFNETRRLMVKCLEPYFDEFRNGLSGDRFAELLFRFLEEHDLYGKIENEAKTAMNEGNLEYSDELKQSWNIIMDILDQLCTISGTKKFTIEKFRDMLEIAFSQKKIGLIPPRTDVVFAGKIDKAFGTKIKMLMMLGTNDPGFPEGVVSEGLLSDKERGELLETGVVLAPDTTTQVLDKQLDVYNLLNLPTESIYISYAVKGSDGEERRPSPFIDRVMELFPALEKTNENGCEASDYIMTPMTGLSYAIRNKSYNPGLVEWYLSNGFERFFCEKADSFSDMEFRAMIRSLLGEILETSATSLESYAACPFKYFADHILDAKERRIFSISSPDVGNLLHEIIKSLSMTYRDKVDPEYKEMIRTAENAFAEVPAGRIFSKNARLSYMGRRIVSRAVDAYLTIRRQIDEGDFKPVEFEADFGRNKRLGAPCYQTGDSRVYLRGRIDRVDAAMIKDNEFFRIIDYKSSHKDIRLCRIKEGLDIQLPLYMMAYMNDTGTKPGGMYYFDAAKKIVSVDYNTEPETIGDKIQEESKLIGYTLADADVIQAMDRNFSKNSRHISVRANAGGQLSGNLITEDDISAMSRVVERHIVEKTNSIYSGEYDVNPVRYQNSWACEYCDFKGICGFDRSAADCRFRSISETKDKDLEWEDSE